MTSGPCGRAVKDRRISAFKVIDALNIHQQLFVTAARGRIMCHITELCDVFEHKLASVVIVTVDRQRSHSHLTHAMPRLTNYPHITLRIDEQLENLLVAYTLYVTMSVRAICGAKLFSLQTTHASDKMGAAHAALQYPVLIFKYYHVQFQYSNFGSTEIERRLQLSDAFSEFCTNFSDTIKYMMYYVDPVRRVRHSDMHRTMDYIYSVSQ